MSRWARLQAWFSRTGSEILGWALVGVGIMLIPLPGPGTLILVAGVALLAQHYHWARRLRDPLRDRAVKAAAYGVQTVPRIAMSVLGGAWLVGIGVVWIIGPKIPEFSVLGITIGPELPGQGWVAGLGLIGSGIVAWVLIAYSIKRWRHGAPTLVA